MSNYTYFYPKKEDYNPKNLTVGEIKGKLELCDRHIEEVKLSIRISLIEAYYKGSKLYMDEIRGLLSDLISAYEKYNRLSNVLTVISEIEEYGGVGVSNVNYQSESEIKTDIDNCNAFLKSKYEDLLILSAIKVSKEEQQQYLRNAYQENIDNIFYEIKQLVYDKTTDEFILKNFNNRKTDYGNELLSKNIAKDKKEENA